MNSSGGPLGEGRRSPRGGPGQRGARDGSGVSGAIGQSRARGFKPGAGERVSDPKNNVVGNLVLEALGILV